MRFTAEHRFPGPPAAVVSILGEPDFYRELDLPDLRLLDVHAVEVSDAASKMRSAGPSGKVSQDKGLVLRYEFTGNLDPVAARLLGGERLTWSQEVHLFGDTGGRLGFAAEADPQVLHGRAEFFFEPEEGPPDRRGGGEAAAEATLRRLDGELVVALPVIGRVAERRIVPGVLARLDVEARAVCRLLEQAGPGRGTLRHHF